MAYTAQDLITRSWFLSGIVARNLQVPTGDQIYDGLHMLNDLLNFKQIETDLIPYYQYITFNCVPQQEYYFLPYVAEVESSTFNLDVVRYPMVPVTRTNYFGSSRVDNIYTLPFSYNYNRAMGGGNLSMYFIPDQPYEMKLQVKIFLVDVKLQTDLTNVAESFLTPSNNYSVAASSSNGLLFTIAGANFFLGNTVTFSGPSLVNVMPSTVYYIVPVSPTTFHVATSFNNAEAGSVVAYTGPEIGPVNADIQYTPPYYTPYTFINNSNQGYDTSYIEYLRYSLAAYMTSEYGVLFNPESQKILDSYKRKLMYLSPPDLSLKKTSILTANMSGGYNWGDVNIGRGYRPS